MQHMIGISRHQLRFSSLEDAITAVNPIRFIDAFVGVLDLTKLGFFSKYLVLYFINIDSSHPENS